MHMLMHAYGPHGDAIARGAYMLHAQRGSTNLFVQDLGAPAMHAHVQMLAHLLLRPRRIRATLPSPAGRLRSWRGPTQAGRLLGLARAALGALAGHGQPCSPASAAASERQVGVGGCGSGGRRWCTNGPATHHTLRLARTRRMPHLMRCGATATAVAMVAQLHRAWAAGNLQSSGRTLAQQTSMLPSQLCCPAQ